MRLLESARPQGSPNNKVTVVFDGRPDVWGAQGGSFVEVLFAREESADEKIKEMVASAQNRKNMVVVTDDRDIRRAVRALGAKVRAVAEFLGKIKTPRSPQASPAGKYISKTLECRITSEMRKIWLEDK